jgi:hypothetical protein
VVTYRPDYRDTSALAKFVFPEPESAALIEWLGEWPDRLSSALAQGVRRILRRGQASARLMARAKAATRARLPVVAPAPTKTLGPTRGR